MGISRGQVSVGRRSSPGVSNGRAVDRHLLVGQVADDRGRQDALDEHVLLEHDRFARVGAHGLEDGARVLGPVVPGDGPDDGLHVGDAANGAAVTVGPVEAQPRAPVVDHQRDVGRRRRAARAGRRGTGGARRTDTGRHPRRAACRSRPCRSGPGRCSARSVRWGITSRHRYDEVGLPCSSTIGSPLALVDVGHPAAQHLGELLVVRHGDSRPGGSAPTVVAGARWPSGHATSASHGRSSVWLPLGGWAAGPADAWRGTS